VPRPPGWRAREDQREGLANLFAQSDAEGEAERAEKEVAVGVEGGAIGEPMNFTM